MPTLHETAYPRIKSTLTDNDLQTVYTPTPEDGAFAEQVGFVAQFVTLQVVYHWGPWLIPRAPSRAYPTVSSD